MVLMVTITAATAVACAGSGGPALKGDPAALIHQAPDRTVATGNARVDASVGSGLLGAGAIDFRSGRGQLSFQRAGASAPRGDRYTIVVDGPTGWLLGASPATDRPWITGPLGTLALAQHDRVAPLDDLLVRPGAGLALAYLRGAVKILPYGGQEVRGVATQRYSFLVDLNVAIAASPPADQPALQEAARAIGPILFPGDVWLDAKGRVRRVQFAEDPKAQTTTTRKSLFTQEGEYLSFTVLDFHDFGRAPPVSAPSAANAMAVG
jgi:hypothetical protein